jgi:hypothetical protein
MNKEQILKDIRASIKWREEYVKSTLGKHLTITENKEAQELEEDVTSLQEVEYVIVNGGGLTEPSFLWLASKVLKKKVVFCGAADVIKSSPISSGYEEETDLAISIGCPDLNPLLLVLSLIHI